MSPRTSPDLEARVQEHILRRIDEARGEVGLRELARRAGVSPSTLAMQMGPEHDRRPNFSISTVVRLAHALRKPVAWFFPGATAAELEADAYRRIAAVVQQTEAQREH